MLKLTQSTAAFLEDLFDASSRHKNPAASLRHFERAFVEPPTPVFREVIDLITPKSRMKKIVILDGHPRTGKSWLAYAAICKVIERQRYGKNDWWNSGVDSLKLFAGESTTLQGGLTNLQDALSRLSKETNRRQPRLLFLDDFFGANTIRSLEQPIDTSNIAEMLNWPEGKGLVELLPEDSVTVITGRSFYFLILETLLGFSLRKPTRENTVNSKLYLCNRRWGVFTSTRRQIVEGGFDSITLREIARSNRQYHPYATKDLNWLLFAAPLLAFDPETELQDSEKPFAALSLFAEDLNTLADQIKALRTSSFATSSPRHRNDVIEELEQAYLSAIAPALAFVGPDAGGFEALGIRGELAQKHRESMYYSAQQQSRAIVPNEYYTRALRDHFADRGRLEFAADCACRALIARSAVETEDAVDRTEVRGLLLRGLVESALHRAHCSQLGVWTDTSSSRASGSSDSKRVGREMPSSLLPLRDITSFNSLLQGYSSTRDVLLRFELGIAEQPNPKAPFLRTAPASPGLVPAIAWVLAKYCPEGNFKELHKSVRLWFRSNVTTQLRMLPDCGITNLGKAKAANWDVLVTSFSTYLQWAIATPDDCERSERVDSLIAMVDGCANQTAKAVLEMVLYDELIWALLEHAVELGTHAVTILRSRLEKLASFKYKDEAERSSAFALMFSLNWHNAWKDGEDAVYGYIRVSDECKSLNPKDWRKLEQLARQIAANSRRMFGALEAADVPAIILNLQYHWLHFTSQRTVWMREWCFHPNPLAFEAQRFSQVAAGSSDSRNNKPLLDMANSLVASKDPTSIRNLMLMLSTRRHYLPTHEFRQFLQRVKQLLLRPSGSASRASLKIATLQAMFELHRQGFLDEAPVVERDFADESLSKMRRNLQGITRNERHFLRWCRELLNDTDSVRMAWNQYRDEVDRVTYITDLHPRKSGYADLIGLLDSKLKSVDQNNRRDL